MHKQFFVFTQSSSLCHSRIHIYGSHRMPYRFSLTAYRGMELVVVGIGVLIIIPVRLFHRSTGPMADPSPLFKLLFKISISSPLF